MEERPQEKVMSKEDMIYTLNQIVAKMRSDDTDRYMSYENMRTLLAKLLNKMKEGA